MKTRWTCEQANEWYAKLGWIRGCNFIGSDCANRHDMLQKYGSEKKLATADKELALCKEIGFNSVRIWANFDVYYAEPESYMEIFEKYISLCAKHGLKVMIVMTHEEFLSRGDKFIPKPMGEQTYTLGQHQGIAPLTPEEEKLTPYHHAEYEETREIFYEMVQRTIRKYANDERIFCWNLYNEPGMFLPSERCMPILKKMFEIARAEDPVQPLCADVWRGTNGGKIQSPEEELALELSDVISFHSYQPIDVFVEVIKFLQKYNRPLFATEWLHRICHNNVKEIYPLLYITNVAGYCWGFVLGKTQTNEPWDYLWQEYAAGRGADFDFTKWQHDLFRPNLRPYDPKEIDLIKRFNAMAEAEGR